MVDVSGVGVFAMGIERLNRAAKAAGFALANDEDAGAFRSLRPKLRGQNDDRGPQPHVVAKPRTVAAWIAARLMPQTGTAS